MSLNFSELLTNFDLMDLAPQMNIRLDDVLMKDQASNKMPNGYYIFNLENSNQGGSHWVALVKVRTSKYYYCDPSGSPPPQTLIDLLKCNPEYFYYNDTQIQHINSILCGYYCLVFLHQMQQSDNMVDNVEEFLQLFYLDTKKNDKELKKICRSLLYTHKIK
jgi:hypothetical protein